MAHSIHVHDNTSGTLRTTSFGDYSSFDIAKNSLDNNVSSKSAQLSYTLELARDNKFDGYTDNGVISEASIVHFYYVDNNGDHVYTGVIYDTDYPNYSAS